MVRSRSHQAAPASERPRRSSSPGCHVVPGIERRTSPLTYALTATPACRRSVRRVSGLRSRTAARAARTKRTPERRPGTDRSGSHPAAAAVVAAACRFSSRVPEAQRAGSRSATAVAGRRYHLGRSRALGGEPGFTRTRSALAGTNRPLRFYPPFQIPNRTGGSGLPLFGTRGAARWCVWIWAFGRLRLVQAEPCSVPRASAGSKEGSGTSGVYPWSSARLYSSNSEP